MEKDRAVNKMLINSHKLVGGQWVKMLLCAVRYGSVVSSCCVCSYMNVTSGKLTVVNYTGLESANVNKVSIMTYWSGNLLCIW